MSYRPFALLGRGNMYYSELLRSVRLPSSGVKRDLQGRLLRYVRRRDLRRIRTRRRALARAVLTLMCALPPGPA